MEWLKQNAWTLAIAAMTLVSTFSLYGYRIQALEAQVDANKTAVEKLNTTVNDQNTQVQVSLAKISTDIEYIKIQVSKSLK